VIRSIGFVKKIFYAFGSRAFVLLPHGSSIVDYSADAMEGNELVHQIGFYLHPAMLQTKDLISLDKGSVA
jgi:hypothetical protein